MMKSAQLAHGEYDKYIVTDLKHKRTCTGHRHWLVFERFWFTHQFDGALAFGSLYHQDQSRVLKQESVDYANMFQK